MAASPQAEKCELEECKLRPILLKQAEEAMYCAKKRGRNTFTLYERPTEFRSAD